MQTKTRQLKSLLQQVKLLQRRIDVAFGLGKLAVLESKLDIYEDLSKEMLDKLERALTTLSENSNKISIVLERHENRLEESDRSDKLIIKMIEEMKDQEEKNHNILHERIDRIQKKVDANQKVCHRCWCSTINCYSIIDCDSSNRRGVDNYTTNKYDGRTSDPSSCLNL